MANLRQWNEAIAEYFLSKPGTHPFCMTEDILREIGTGKLDLETDDVVKNFLSSMLKQETGYEQRDNHPVMLVGAKPENIFVNGTKIMAWYRNDLYNQCRSGSDIEWGKGTWNFPDDTIPWLSHLGLILLSISENIEQRVGHARYPTIGDYIYHHVNGHNGRISSEQEKEVSKIVKEEFLLNKQNYGSWLIGAKFYLLDEDGNVYHELWVWRFLGTWSKKNKSFPGEFPGVAGYVLTPIPVHLLIRKDDRDIIGNILSDYDKSLPLDERSLLARLRNVPRYNWSDKIASDWRTYESSVIEQAGYIWDSGNYENISDSGTGNSSNSVQTTFLLAPYLYIDDSSNYSFPIKWKGVRLHYLSGPKPSIGDSFSVGDRKVFIFSRNNDFSEHLQIAENGEDDEYFSSTKQLKVEGKDGKIGLATTIGYALDKSRNITIVKGSNDGMYGYDREDKVSGGYNFSIINRNYLSNNSNLNTVLIGNQPVKRENTQPPTSGKKRVKLTDNIEILPVELVSGLETGLKTKIRFEGGIKLIGRKQYYFDGDESLPRARLIQGIPDNVKFFPNGLDNAKWDGPPTKHEDRKGIYWKFRPIINVSEDTEVEVQYKYSHITEKGVYDSWSFTILHDTYGMWQEHDIDDALEEKELIEPTFSFSFKHNFLTHRNEEEIDEEEIDEEQMQKTSVPMNESRKPEESEKRQQRPRALMSESEGEKKSEPPSKPKERNEEGKKDEKKSSEETGNSGSVIVWFSSLKPVIKCASCGVPLATKGHVKFNCPECSTEIIGRCRRCRINSVPYKCKNIDCNFEGP